MPMKCGCMEGSDRRTFTSLRPMFSASSWNKILMKMRLDEVVSSSVISMLDSTCDSHPFNIPFH